MVILIGIVFILLVVISNVFHVKNQCVENENKELDLELQNLKKIRKEQYENDVSIRDTIYKYVQAFNDLAEQYLKMSPEFLQYEKKYYKEIHSDKYCYSDEYKTYQDVWCLKKKNEGSLRKAIFKFKRKYHAKELINYLQQEYSKCVIEGEDIDRDFAYERHNYFNTILIKMLKKWLWIILGISAAIVVLMSNPILFVIFIIAILVCLYFDSAWVMLISLLVGIVTFIATAILVIINIGMVLRCLALIYFSFGLIAAVYQAFKIYNSELQEEKKHIEERIELAKIKINEAQRVDKDSNIYEFEAFIITINNEVQRLQCIIKEGLKNNSANMKNEYIYAYWDTLFFGNCFLKGISRNGGGLDFVFIKNFLQNVEKMSNLKWRK